MRQGISVEYVRYFNRAKQEIAVFGILAFIFGSVSCCGWLSELILLGCV